MTRPTYTCDTQDDDDPRRHRPRPPGPVHGALAGTSRQSRTVRPRRGPRVRAAVPLADVATDRPPAPRRRTPRPGPDGFPGPPRRHLPVPAIPGSGPPAGRRTRRGAAGLPVL